MTHATAPPDPPEPNGAAAHTRPEAGTGPQYRVTLIYGDTVTPPEVPGEIALMVDCSDRVMADQEIEIAAGRTDLSRILLEERQLNDVAEHQNEWRTVHSWTRTAEGWRVQ